jgi:hypothetical protein
LERQDGRRIELEGPNRVVRLLEAAAEDREVEAPRPEHQERFAELGEFASLPPSIAFRRLVELVPELATMESLIAAAAAMERPVGDDSTAGTREWIDMCLKLDALVGPHSNHKSTLLRSQVAQDIARWELARPLC